MAKEVIEAEVKSNIGKVTKDAQGLASEFKVMGVSLNSLKSSLKSVASTAKASFSTWKKAAMSTGIGALVIAVGSLVTWFNKTKKGAEALEKVFAGVGAAVNVIVDRVSKFGGAIVKLFQKDTKGALEDLKATFSGIGEEIVNDTKRAIELKKAFQELRDSQRDLNVETAKQRAEIERLKLIAEDTTKSEEVRLKAAQDAFDIENKLLDQRVANAEEALRIQRQEMELGENLAEDLDKEAELEINLFNIKQESITKQIELNNKINGIKREAEAKEIAALEELKRLDQERYGNLVVLGNLFEQQINKQIDGYDKLFKASDFTYKKQEMIEMSLRELSENRIEWAAMTDNERLNLAKNTLNDLGKIAGEETQLGKALAITQTTISTYQSAQESYKSLSGIPVIGPALGGVAAAAAIAMGLKNIQAIRSAGKDGVKNTSNISTPNMSGGTPAPEMLSGQFTLGGGQEAQPVQAYVVTDDMTNNQNKLANIRRRATI